MITESHYIYFIFVVMVSSLDKGESFRAIVYFIIFLEEFWFEYVLASVR